MIRNNGALVTRLATNVNSTTDHLNFKPLTLTARGYEIENHCISTAMSDFKYGLQLKGDMNMGLRDTTRVSA